MSEECDEEYEALDVKSLYDPLPGRIAAGLLLSYFAMGITYVSLIGFSLGSRQGLVAGLLVLVTLLFANVFSFLCSNVYLVPLYLTRICAVCVTRHC